MNLFKVIVRFDAPVVLDSNSPKSSRRAMQWLHEKLPQPYPLPLQGTLYMTLSIYYSF